MLLGPLSLSGPYLDRQGVEAMVQGHLAGYRNYTNELHKVLTLELIHRAFLDSPTGREGASDGTLRSLDLQEITGV
jgi:asparagine synthase (glutamine-hydrolysing)